MIGNQDINDTFAEYFGNVTDAKLFDEEEGIDVDDFSCSNNAKDD